MPRRATPDQTGGCQTRGFTPCRGCKIWSSASRDSPIKGQPAEQFNEGPSPHAERGFVFFKPPFLFEVFVDFVEESGGGEPLLLGADQERQVLGHEAGLDRVD